MRAPLAVLLIGCACLATGFARADDGNSTQDPTPFTCDSRTGQFHIYDAKEHARKAFALKRWKAGPGKGHLAEIRSHRSCLDRAKDRKPISRYLDGRRDRFRMYREYRQITPYRCQAGRYGTWAIPCYIIACESGFSWSAYNPSGASGPYQLLGWGAPMPANTWARKLAHHRIAYDLYNGGSGRSNWVC